jgi:Uncharacterized protein conserved in bacteria (DUF2062)
VSVSAIAARFAAVTVGLTPEKLALLIAAGFVLGTFPVLGFASVLCVVAALVLRLNLPALQVVGQAVTPLQYALLLPLARLGARVTGFRTGIGGAVFQAVTGWLCVVVPLGIVLYATLVFLMRMRVRRNMVALETIA